MKILIAEDELRLAEALCDVLQSHGYETHAISDGAKALTAALGGGYDAMILDVMLPGMDGFAIARALRRKNTSLPILMLTARSEVSDRVRGLDCGADYYLTKPFSNDELLACLAAVLRRPGQVGGGVLHFGELQLELFSGRLSRAGRAVQLTGRELEILRMIASAGSGGVKKERLFLKIWGYDADCESNVLEQYISFLRRKLRYLGGGAAIVSDRGSGYHMEWNG